MTKWIEVAAFLIRPMPQFQIEPTYGQKFNWSQTEKPFSSEDEL